MLGFVKHRLPEHLLSVLAQCQRNPQCIYATGIKSDSQLKASDSSNLESVHHWPPSWRPGGVLASLEVCDRCLKSPSTDHHHIRDERSSELMIWMASTSLHLPSLRDGKVSSSRSLEHKRIKSCRVHIHGDPLHPRNNRTVPHLQSHGEYHEVPESSSDAKAFFKLLLAENALVENRWLGLMQPSVGLDRSNLRSLSFVNYQQQLMHPENVSIVLLCQFFDRNALRHGELSTRQVFFKSGCSLSNDKQEVPSMQNNLPSAEKLQVIQDYLPDNMSRLFLSNHDYRVYVEDVVFENNWYMGNSYTNVGRLLYMVEVAKLRLFVHLRLANVRVQLLKTTSHPEDGTVRARWRVSGIPQSRAFMFWNFLPWNKKRHSIAIEPEWLDGFSIFFVNQQGLINKHKMDRVIPDEDRDVKASVMEEKLDEITAPATS